jgi:hypothetical protein
MKYLRQIITALIFIASMYSLAPCQDYKDITRDYRLNFPDDFYYKRDYRFQWWYFTGHLFDETGREFGYELTFLLSVSRKRLINPGLDYAISIYHILRFQMLLKRYFFSLINQTPVPLILRVPVKISLTSGLVKTVWKGE